MKLIDPSFEIIEQEGSSQDYLYKMIEKCAKTCYKSVNTITDDSAEKFVDRLVKAEHYAMLEHATVYLKIPFNIPLDLVVKGYSSNPYSWVSIPDNNVHIAYVTTNYRVIKENSWEEDLKYMCTPTKYHEKRVTVRFVCSRAVAQEFTRHRVFSFAMESQRYCNYSRDKFGNEITFIIPDWVNTHCPNKNQKGPSVVDMEWSTALMNAEASYFNLLKEGWKPEEAREVLPNSTKTELIMTGFVDDWKHFFDLRALGTTGKPHPEAYRLAFPLMEEFKKMNYIKLNKKKYVK
jgi:thymidylate synthase (FAD)